jgi:hypothetical protein
MQKSILARIPVPTGFAKLYAADPIFGLMDPRTKIQMYHWFRAVI